MFKDQCDQTEDGKQSGRVRALTAALADCEVIRRISTMSDGRPLVDFAPAPEGVELGRTFAGRKSSS